MHRGNLIKLLQEYNPIESEEILFKQNVLNFIKKHDNCFERSLTIGHITSSCLLLNKQQDKALLMHHAKLNKWFQLGGHCDGNPDTLSVAIKEAQEESGILNIEPVSNDIFDLDIHLIPANSKEKEHYHYDVRFLLHVTSDEQIKQNNESKELKWIGKNYNELPTDNLSVIRMFKKWIDSKINICEI